MSKLWQRLSAQLDRSYRILDVWLETYRSPRTDQPFTALVFTSADWVNVVALTDAREVVMIRQFRFGSGDVTLEIPGGIVDPGEAPLDAARRELEEETGYTAARFTSLGSIAPNPALHRNRLHCFLAEGCTRSSDQLQDAGEDIAVELHPLADIDGLLASGAISHALVAVAFQKLTLLRAGLPLA